MGRKRFWKHLDFDILLVLREHMMKMKWEIWLRSVMTRIKKKISDDEQRDILNKRTISGFSQMLTLQELDSISTERLVEAHDELAEGNVDRGGTQYYLDEYRFRKNLQIAETMRRYTKAIYWFTATMLIITILNFIFFLSCK